MSAPAYFDEMAVRLRSLLSSLRAVLSSSELEEVEHFINHREFGEALRTLAWIIVEERKRIPISALAEIEHLADRMEIRDDLPEALPDHRLDGE